MRNETVQARVSLRSDAPAPLAGCSWRSGLRVIPTDLLLLQHQADTATRNKKTMNLTAAWILFWLNIWKLKKHFFFLWKHLKQESGLQIKVGIWKMDLSGIQVCYSNGVLNSKQNSISISISISIVYYSKIPNITRYLNTGQMDCYSDGDLNTGQFSPLCRYHLHT